MCINLIRGLFTDLRPLFIPTMFTWQLMFITSVRQYHFDKIQVVSWSIAVYYVKFSLQFIVLYGICSKNASNRAPTLLLSSKVISLKNDTAQESGAILLEIVCFQILPQFIIRNGNPDCSNSSWLLSAV